MALDADDEEKMCFYWELIHELVYSRRSNNKIIIFPLVVCGSLPSLSLHKT